MRMRLVPKYLLFRSISAFLLAAVTACGVSVRMEGQSRPPSGGRAHNPGLPGWCETPVADRKEEGGCYTTAILNLGVLPRPSIYWHLDTFPTRAAAEAARSPRSVVVESLHRYWLFTIAEQSWRPVGGERIAIIGPLVIEPNTPYTARYMETVIPPGFQPPGGPGHRHPGPEAWYVVAGGQCLETPNGVLIAHAGETMLAPEGWPMAIASLGNDTRRAVVLVLHRSSEPYVMPVSSPSDAPHAHWTSKGLCPK